MIDEKNIECFWKTASKEEKENLCDQLKDFVEDNVVEAFIEKQNEKLTS